MITPQKIELIASDLDGTLKQYGYDFEPADIETLHRLGEKGIVRVIATGRNQHFAREVLPDDFPIDYLIFASGAGIVRWSDKKLLMQQNIPSSQIEPLINVLVKEDINFVLHRAIPKEHYFYYHQNREYREKEVERTPVVKDYYLRVEEHRRWGEPLSAMSTAKDISCVQAIAFIKDDMKYFQKLAQNLQGFEVVRTTSPTAPKDSDGVLWVEVFAKSVSKGSALLWLCQQLGIDRKKTLGFGNDYNDLDLLETTAYSWVIENAPADLRRQFSVCSGFADLILTKQLLLP